MNAKQLRNSILQMAIQGKLVPQDPNDEPASVLLDKIRQEKVRLVKEGKLKKKDLVETPINEDEKTFEIPKGWKWVHFGDVSYNRDSERIPLSVSERSSLKKTYDYYGASGVIDKVDRYLFNKPLLLIGEDGANLINRSTPIAFIARGKYWVNNHAHVLDFINEDFMEYVCLHINAISLVDYVTGTAQPKMNQEKMNSIPLAIPPKEEQKRILSKIEELMPIVDEYGKAQEEADKLQAELPDKLRKSILQEAIQGKLVPQDPNDEPASVLLEKIRQEKKRLVKEGVLKKKDLEETPISDDEKPFDIPESWEWCRMQDVIQFVNGRAYKKEELLDKGKYKVLRVGNFFTNDSWYYSDLELPEDKYCNRGDLLYAWSASFGPKIWEGEKTIFHYHIWNVKFEKSMLYREYLYYFFVADKNVIKSSTTGSTMVHVSMENMKPRLIPIPPLAEQYRIVAKIEELFNELK